MKVFALLSVAASTFAFSSQGQAANIPDPSVDINTCLASAQAPAERHRCYALDNCIKNQSSGKEQLKECLFAAEETYRAEAGAAEARGPIQGYGGALPPPPAVTTPIATEVPNSDYSIKGGDAKGWMNSTQGD